MFSLNLSSEQTEAEYLLESGLFQMQNQVNKFSENQHTLLSVKAEKAKNQGIVLLVFLYNYLAKNNSKRPQTRCIVTTKIISVLSAK